MGYTEPVKSKIKFTQQLLVQSLKPSFNIIYCMILNIKSSDRWALLPIMQ